ncbi:MAG: DUF2470 domain-containing protein [Geminicoccaceae bacterium]|nr:DUF2470 domain-containing protein [Geminicoccaceae bacterium]
MSEEDPAATVRRIVRSTDRAALGTRLKDMDGAPYVSLVLAATDHIGRPLLLLSDLADHTKNLEADPSASLLFDATGGGESALAGERATLVGRIVDDADPSAGERYLRRHPSASIYAGFADFRLYRFEPARAHLVAGFGRIHWLDGDQILVPPAAALAQAEAEIARHMNADHGDALLLYARHLLGLPGDGWRVTGIDPQGLDLRAGGLTGRLIFRRRVEDPAAARAELVRLAGEARARAGGQHPA